MRLSQKMENYFLSLPEDEREAAVEKYIAEYREKRRLYQQAYRARRPEVHREAYRKYMEKNKKKIAKQRPWVERDARRVEKKQEYRQKTMERHLAYKREWSRKNREKVREQERRHYHRAKAANMARTKPDELRALLRRQLPGYLDAQSRADIINEVIAAILDHKVFYGELSTCVKPFVTAHNRMYDHFKTLSLDAPIPGMDGMTYMDRLEQAVN